MTISDHILNIVVGFFVTYLSTAVYWLSRHRKGMWRWIAVLLLVTGSLGFALSIILIGQGGASWDWWVVCGWVFGWLAWALTRRELGLPA